MGFKKQFQNNELRILAPKLHFIKQLYLKQQKGVGALATLTIAADHHCWESCNANMRFYILVDFSGAHWTPFSPQ